jgi:hypothetical protein
MNLTAPQRVDEVETVEPVAQELGRALVAPRLVIVRRPPPL